MIITYQVEIQETEFVCNKKALREMEKNWAFTFNHYCLNCTGYLSERQGVWKKSVFSLTGNIYGGQMPFPDCNYGKITDL
jgi:hypothetical protein